MRVVKLSEESYAQLEQEGSLNIPDRMKRYQEIAKQIQADLNAPIELSSVTKVTYDPKMDRYTATFIGSEKTVVLKITDEVAAFLTTHLREAGSWRGRMAEGVLVDAYLVTY